jgi:Malectin domain
MRKSIPVFCCVCLASLSYLFLVGCESNKSPSATNEKPASAAPAPAIAAVSAPPAVAAPVSSVVRINAGASTAVTNSSGDVWLADQGFSGGDVIERPDLTIANTTEPEIYRSEHYSMDSFSWPLANGKYLVKLHFCETFDGITDKGQRVFSFNVQGHEFKDFDVWAKANGPLTAYVETVPVEITDGKLLVTFTSNVENPQINAIEIIPQL